MMDQQLTYREARDAAIAAFERNYVVDLLARYEGNVSAAARAVHMDRVYLHRMMRRHGIRSTDRAVTT